MIRLKAILTILSGVVLAATAEAKLTITIEPPNIAHKVFDPAHPPAEMPRLEPGEAAVTASDFLCQSSVGYAVTDHHPPEGGCTSELLVNDVTITTKLNVTVWLPNDASPKLKAHEEGHRRLVEQIYRRQAEYAARVAGATIDNHRLTGHGGDCQAASRNAVDPAIKSVGDRYLALTASISEQINATYDELTRHGTNQVPEEKASREALEKYVKAHPDGAEALGGPPAKKE